MRDIGMFHTWDRIMQALRRRKFLFVLKRYDITKCFYNAALKV